MKNKRWFPIAVFFFCLFGMLAVPCASSVAHAEEGGAPGTEQSYTCPHGGTAGGQPIGTHTCWTCGGAYGITYTADFWDIGVDHGYPDGEYIEGLGLQYVDNIDGESKTRTYYRCKNCGECKEHSIEVKKEYYKLVDGDWVLNTKKGDGGVEEIDMGSKAVGYVPIRWCNICGPKDAGYTIASYYHKGLCQSVHITHK